MDILAIDEIPQIVQSFSHTQLFLCYSSLGDVTTTDEPLATSTVERLPLFGCVTLIQFVMDLSKLDGGGVVKDLGGMVKKTRVRERRK